MSMGTGTQPTRTAGASGPAQPALPGASFQGNGGPFAGSLSGLRKAATESETHKSKAPAVDETGPYAGMSPKERRAAKRAASRLKGTFEDYPYLLAMKPKEGYAFRSDYFTVDGTVACVLGFFHDDAAIDGFGAFWGINRIPAGLGEGVSVVVFEQVRRMGEKWVADRIQAAEKLDQLEGAEQAEGGTATTKRKSAKISGDISDATAEIQDGAAYLHVHNRLLVKAPTLAALDEAIETIARRYVDLFGTIKVAAYPGEQRQELGGLFRKNDKKRGRGSHFTSVEFAGSHSLVTNGLNDPKGEYVGTMRGDVNNSAVLFDVNGYSHHVVIADSAVNLHLGRSHISDMWGSKVSQSALLNNGRVVHLVLDGANLDVLGPKLSGLTARLDMNSGDINMFEMFGDKKDEMSIYSAHLDKIVLMAEQAYETTDADRSIIRGALRETLNTFYIDKGMWVRNAGANRDRLRLVGLDHTHIPRLQDLVTYFETQYKAMAASDARDDEALHAYNVLRLVFKDLLDTNGDLFNTFTNEAIDGVQASRRVLYDFSQLLRRGKGVAMAQLVNTVGFAVDNLGLGDTVIIHGTEYIDEGVKVYINAQFERMFARGGRVAYLYNEVDKMLDDADFNHFEKADWTVLGTMSPATVARYQKHLTQDIPTDLERLVTNKSGVLQSYLRRGVTNVVFALDLALGVNPKRAAQREAAEAEARAQIAARRQILAPRAPAPNPARTQRPRATSVPAAQPQGSRQRRLPALGLTPSTNRTEPQTRAYPSR